MSLHVDNVSADAIFTGILHDTDHLSFFLEYIHARAGFQFSGAQNFKFAK